MSWSIKRDKSFGDLVEFSNSTLRKFLDLQYRSILISEKILFNNSNLYRIKVLDFGAGNQEFCDRHACLNYKSVDPHVAATWKSELEIPLAERFDLIVSTEVFEHLRNPFDTLKRISRFQNKGQKLYITVPFLARQHGAPDDFQRWTESGIVALLGDAGYSVDNILRRGNLISVLSALLNFKLFNLVRSIYFPFALVLAPFALIFLALAHLTMTVNSKTDTYLGLSILATKSEDL